MSIYSSLSDPLACSAADLMYVHNANRSNRMLTNPNATTIYGGVFADKTFIRVQWWWFSLSVVLELAAALFLGVVMYRTHKAQQYAWKSSLYPLIYGQSWRETDADSKKASFSRDSLEMDEFLEAVPVEAPHLHEVV